MPRIMVAGPRDAAAERPVPVERGGFSCQADDLGGGRLGDELPQLDEPCVLLPGAKGLEGGLHGSADLQPQVQRRNNHISYCSTAHREARAASSSSWRLAQGSNGDSLLATCSATTNPATMALQDLGTMWHMHACSPGVCCLHLSPPTCDPVTGTLRATHLYELGLDLG